MTHISNQRPHAGFQLLISHCVSFHLQGGGVQTQSKGIGSPCKLTAPLRLSPPGGRWAWQAEEAEVQPGCPPDTTGRPQVEALLASPCHTRAGTVLRTQCCAQPQGHPHGPRGSLARCQENSGRDDSALQGSQKQPLRNPLYVNLPPTACKTTNLGHLKSWLSVPTASLTEVKGILQRLKSWWLWEPCSSEAAAGVPWGNLKTLCYPQG